MTLYQRMIAPILYYPGQSFEPKKKYIESPVKWYPEDMQEELKKKYKDLNNYWDIVSFEERYEPYAEKPKFKRLKVPKTCKDCKSCNIAVTGSPYCHMEAISSNNSQMDISTIYVDINSRPVWCPIIKTNKELDAMPIESRANIDKIITGLSSLNGSDDLWEETNEGDL